MKTALILHGMPSEEEYFDPNNPTPSNNHWLPWMRKELFDNGIVAEVLDFPEPYKPDYEKWKKIFEQHQIDQYTILIGHSCGGGFLVRWLSENKIPVGKVALVAPWINPKDPRPIPGFFDFEIDTELADRTEGISLFVSSDDDKEELETAEFLQEKIKGLKVLKFTDRGHFVFGDMKTNEFPELLNEVI